MRHRHSMPFGAEILQDGAMRFRLWAPAARAVDVHLEGRAAGEILPMRALEAGWFELITDRAAAGSLYRYRIDAELLIPDPASRYNPRDVHGPSQVIDPLAFDWLATQWRGRSWEEAVIYELHVGTFSSSGTFDGVSERLGYLADLGVSAIELMPVADFPGARNWGYDGVLPFAPDSAYGHPNGLKHLVDSAHRAGLMVFLDVVYNHFGPEGNYLHRYAPQFFTQRHHTPWGAAINYDGAESRTVRDFFIQNALYWLEEFRFDGLRLDAVDRISDDSAPHILEEVADAARSGPGKLGQVHLVLENDDNAVHYLRARGRRPARCRAQWNDDVHHALHTLVTGEVDGYYSDYADQPARHLARCLAEGFAYQGEPSPFRGGRLRGERSRGLPPTAFITFLQNHDQVGNRALGERLPALADSDALRAAVAIVLLAPQPPLLFMGEEFGALSPFQFFCDFEPELARGVTDGRRSEFARFKKFGDPAAREHIPDPNAIATFERSKLDWDCLAQAPHADWLAFYRFLLELRSREITRRLAGIKGAGARWELLGERALKVDWTLGDGSRLSLLANLGALPIILPKPPQGRLIYRISTAAGDAVPPAVLPAWTVAWHLREIAQSVQAVREAA